MVFDSNFEMTNTHFTNVGLALGLVRIKAIHLGVIDDLKLTLCERAEAEKDKQLTATETTETSTVTEQDNND